MIIKGVLCETFVGQELIAYGAPWRKQELFYWQREARGSNAEVDYLVQRRGEILPVEVKSGARGRLKSLKLFLQEKRKDHGIRFSGHAFSKQPDLHSYPLYAVSTFLKDSLPPSVDQWSL